MKELTKEAVLKTERQEIKMRFIDRHEAYMFIKHEAETHELPASKEAYERAARIVAQMHPVNIAIMEQKTGRWIDITVGDMPAQACDQCKTFYPLAYTGGGHQYCPNCGAKMESEVE